MFIEVKASPASKRLILIDVNRITSIEYLRKSGGAGVCVGKVCYWHHDYHYFVKKLCLQRIPFKFRGKEFKVDLRKVKK